MGGDLAGITQQLDYIQSLGVTCLYLTPIFRAPSNHKYDTADYFEIDPAFGTKDDLRRLVDGVHARGMRIILDGVFNHCGYWWDKFQDVVKNGKASPYRSWFFIHSYPVDAERQNYDCVGHYKWMPKLNLADPDARDYFFSVGRYWLEEFGIDGWRLDVADELPTAFLEAFAAAMRACKPDCILLGETWGDAGRLVSANRLDSAMNYLFRDAAAAWLAKDALSASEFGCRLNRALALYPNETNLRMYNLLDSHDTARFLYEAGGDKARLRLAAALQMTFPGSPAIFYGDEVGLSGPNDPGCRMAMQWDAGTAGQAAAALVPAAHPTAARIRFSDRRRFPYRTGRRRGERIRLFARRARRADARRPARRNGTLARAAPDPRLGTGICRMDALLPDGRHDKG